MAPPHSLIAVSSLLYFPLHLVILYSMYSINFYLFCSALSESYKSLLTIPSICDYVEQQELLNTDVGSGSWYNFDRQFSRLQ